jgi:hypothetical protein
MKKTILSGKGLLLLLVLAIGFTTQVSAKGHASKPGEHPAYLHALSNLRAARWLIEHRPGNWQQTNDEMEAVKRIDAAIAEIKKAAIEDGKNLEDHPGVEDRKDHGGRLHLAIDFLRKAHNDVDKEEDNGFAHGLKARAIDHIDGAIHATERAIAAGKY